MPEVEIGESGAVLALIPLLRRADPWTHQQAVTALLTQSLLDENNNLAIYSSSESELGGTPIENRRRSAVSNAAANIPTASNATPSSSYLNCIQKAVMLVQLGVGYGE
ncbi:hypothetical protein E3N88_28145 [Mikania micrantha]|uniref:Uncharacterized protein n=1 Tax=Mikania micrantha TaxID=192012 RepID=A0A5N6N0A0_9ASTR|nr:hypothetical protein E3N88_28145 [Mikania micrantha]